MESFESWRDLPILWPPRNDHQIWKLCRAVVEPARIVVLLLARLLFEAIHDLHVSKFHICMLQSRFLACDHALIRKYSGTSCPIQIQWLQGSVPSFGLTTQWLISNYPPANTSSIMSVRLKCAKLYLLLVSVPLDSIVRHWLSLGHRYTVVSALREYLSTTEEQLYIENVRSASDNSLSLKRVKLDLRILQGSQSGDSAPMS